ncbi:MAG: hypothetical protein SGILL_006147 [Bacillariaceae sp.]
MNACYLVLPFLVLSSVQAYGGTFDAHHVCAGKHATVIKSEADQNSAPDGWFVYSKSMIVCCDGKPHDIMCSEMMVGNCDCPNDVISDTEYSIACYGRQCPEEVIAAPIHNGVQVDEGSAAMCFLPEHLAARGTQNNVTVTGEEFCMAYGAGPDSGINSNVPLTYDKPEETGAFELLINEDTGNSSTGIVPVHMVMIPHSTKAVMWSRGQQPNIPAQPGTEFAVSVVYDWSTGKYDAVDVDSNPFCSGVGYSHDGNIIAMGGEQENAPWGHQWQPSQYIEGRNKIREFDVNTNRWTTLDTELPGNHWYPTQVLLEDGRILNQGGFESMVGPQQEKFEIYDSKTKSLVKYYNTTEFADTMSIMNLYPFFNFLPYTNPEKPDDIYLFMDLCNHAEMYTISKDNDLQQKKVLPTLGGDDRDICAAFSAVGFSRFLPFKPPYNKPEYIAFGGIENSTEDMIEGKCWSDIQGSNKSFRISVNVDDIMNNRSHWEEEEMPFARVGGLSVTLPNGEMVLMNGGKRGMGNDYVRDPVRTAVLYDPDAPSGQRYTTLASSNLKRLYHNVAMLLPDGNVLVAGGEQGESYTPENGGPWCGTNYDYEFQSEIFKPPYVFKPNERPNITSVERHEGPQDTFEFGQTVRVYYEGDEDLTVDGATITSPSAVTHGTEMHSKTVFLKTRTCSEQPVQNNRPVKNLRGGRRDTENAQKCVEVVLPKSEHRVTVAGWHMLFLLNGKSPSLEAKWIKIE